MRPALAIIKNLRVTRTLVRAVTKRIRIKKLKGARASARAVIKRIQVCRPFAYSKNLLSRARNTASSLTEPFLPRNHPADRSSLIEPFLPTNHPADEHPLKKHPLKLIIDTLHDDDDPWPVEWMMFNVLNDYLQPNTKLSVDEAAQCLDAIVPENRPDKPGEEKEPALNWMLEMSDLIWKVAKQIPYDHEAQDKLVHLIQALHRLPITASYAGYAGQVPIWRGWFQGWCDSHHQFLGYPEKSRNPPKIECDQHINVNAFAARVQAAGAMDCCGLSNGYFAIHAAVTDPIKGRCSRDRLPCHITAGAQWVVLATEWLWSEIRWGKIDYIKVNTDGSKCLCYPPSVWVTWMRGFQQLAATGETGDVKYWTGLAAEKMEEVMRTQGFTAEVMEAWDPEKRSLRADMWEDERYAHLFKFLEKASKAAPETVSDPETAPETISDTASDTTSETTSEEESEEESEPGSPATSKETSPATSPATSETNSDEESDKA